MMKPRAWTWVVAVTSLTATATLALSWLTQPFWRPLL